MYDDFEDFEDLEQRSKEIQKQLKKKARSEFIQGCYTAYDILEREGPNALEKGELPSICRAINRMMSLFLSREEYERCGFLKKYVEENIPGHKIEPDPLVVQELSDM
jgi:hypothetical protein